MQAALPSLCSLTPLTDAPMWECIAGVPASPLCCRVRGHEGAGVESLDDAGSSLAASFDPAANAWVALSATRGVVEVRVDTDWQEVPRDALPGPASPAAAPSGQARICPCICWGASSMVCSHCVTLQCQHQARYLIL